MVDSVKHTPGPWGISHGGLPGDSGFSVVSRNAEAENVKVTAECWPCTIVSEDHRQELFANARLIAKAPELLAMVDLFADIAERMPKPTIGQWNWTQLAADARALIASVNGQ